MPVSRLTYPPPPSPPPPQRRDRKTSDCSISIWGNEGARGAEMGAAGMRRRRNSHNSPSFERGCEERMRGDSPQPSVELECGAESQRKRLDKGRSRAARAASTKTGTGAVINAFFAEAAAEQLPKCPFIIQSSRSFTLFILMAAAAAVSLCSDFAF